MYAKRSIGSDHGVVRGDDELGEKPECLATSGSLLKASLICRASSNRLVYPENSASASENRVGDDEWKPVESESNMSRVEEIVETSASVSENRLGKECKVDSEILTVAEYSESSRVEERRG
jgi:hypothetical protein